MNRFDSGPFVDFYQKGQQQRLHEQGGQVRLLSLVQQQQWLDVIASTQGVRRFPGAILPRLTDVNVVYYVLAQSETEWRNLWPLVRAFAGGTILWEYPVIDTDPLDHALLVLGYAVIKKYSVPRSGSQQLFEDRKFRAIQAMKNLALGVLNAPVMERNAPRTLAAHLDLFELALNAGDQQSCHDIIGELKEGNYLDHMNLLFLQVRVFQRAGDWEGLRQWESFSRLCKARRPGRITAFLIKALYNTELAVLGNDLDLLLDKFRTAILPICGNLFNEFPEMADDDVLCAFAVHAIAADENKHWRWLEERALHAMMGSFPSLWNGCQDREGKPVAPAPGAPTVAVDIAPAPPTREALTNAIALAYAENCRQHAQMAVDLFEACSKLDQDAVLGNGNVSVMWHHLVNVLLGDWDRCFDTLCNGSDVESSKTLHDALNEWPAKDQLAGTMQATNFLEKLELVLGHEIGSAHLVDNLEPLVTWIKEDPEFPRKEGVPIYVILLELFALSERITPQRLESFSDLLEQVLTCPLLLGQYGRVLEAAELLVNESQAHRAVDWMINLVGVVLDNHSLKAELREKLLWTVLAKVKSLRVELSHWQREAFRVLLRVLQQDADSLLKELPSSQETSPLEGCANKSLAIYTLDEKSGKRAKEIINTICPTAQITILSDTHGSAALKHQAKNADIFVVVWRSAKHAATIDIKNNRPKGKTLLQPTGKGTSGILLELERHMRQQL